ncbi:hypothetical protein [Lactobacillus crispatus]|uniref:hypothetical protein n=1 Tax=Lactobacillus crispatus TaxID=47770 RepID=UPI00254D1272|nr:hypothetical protein [Lactobacillus crispatus]MDK6378071.1 hypothetical protein [Lactobacillus crispatus]
MKKKNNIEYLQLNNAENSEDFDIEHKKNPFVFNMEIDTKKKKLTVDRGSELETEEGVFTTTISQIQEVDKEEFLKLFTGQIKFYFDLTQTGFKLFFLIMGIYQKQIGGDEIYLNFETAKEEAEKYDYTISKAVYYRGLKVLLEKKMIAKSVKKYIFYINPAIVFNGDRARFVKEIRIKEEEKQREADLKSINERLDRYA